MDRVKSIFIRHAKTLQLVAMVLALLAILLTFLLPIDEKKLLATGYIGVFVVTLLSAVSLLPGPSAIAAFIAGGSLNPLLVSIVAGLGSSIGETTGYLAGYGSHGVIDNLGSGPNWLKNSKFYKSFFESVLKWMSHSPFITIFLIAAIPNFFVDIVGIIAGRAKYSFIKFFIAMLLGKIIRFAMGAYLGAFFIQPD